MKRFQLNKKPITTQIHVLTGLLIIAFIFGELIVLNGFTRYYRKLIYANMQDNLNKMALHIETEFDRLENTAIIMMTDADMQKDLEDFTNTDALRSHVARQRVGERFAAYISRTAYVKRAFIYDKSGNNIWAASSEANVYRGELNKILSDTAWMNDETLNYRFSEASENTVYFIFSYYDFWTSSWDRTGYYIAFVVNLKDIVKPYYNSGNFSGYTIISNELGEYIVNSNDSIEVELGEVEQYEDEGKLIAKINNKKSFVFNLHNETNRFYYTNIMEYSKINREIWGLQIHFYIYTVLVSVLLFIGAIKFTKRITDPIKGLFKAIKKLEKGNFEIHSLVPSENNTKNEIHIFKNEFFSMTERLNSFIQKNYIMECSLKKSQLKALQSQINPHFLYNTLDTVYWTVEGGDSEKSAALIKSLSNLFRYSTDIINDEVPLNIETDMLKSYFDIQTVRYEGRIIAEIKVDSIFYDVLIPKFSLQPLVENAISITDNLMGRVNNIVITAKEADGDMEVLVYDSGSGLARETLDSILSDSDYSINDGVALYNIDKRIKLFHGDKYGVFARIENGRSVVGFTVPIIQEGKDNYENT